VNRFGVDTTAAFGAALQIWNYIQMPAFAVGMGMSAMTAQNVGAGKWDRVTHIARVGVLYSVLLTTPRCSDCSCRRDPPRSASRAT
jgi:Na+-driven multidrug efflux pump